MIKKLIMIAGKKQSGKDSLAAQMIEIFGGETKAVSIAFADEVKLHLHEIFGLSLEKLYGTDAEKNELTHLVHNGEQLSYRRAMQVFGSDECRAKDKHCWARKCWRKVLELPHEFVIITDLRLFDELRYIAGYSQCEDIELKTIKLSRDSGADDNHESEKGIDSIPPAWFNLIVPPDYDQNETWILVKYFLEKWGYIK